MEQDELKKYVDDQINSIGDSFKVKGDSSDEVSVGKLFFFTTLRAALNGKVGKKELGLLDAINDTLQKLGKIESKETFYK